MIVAPELLIVDDDEALRHWEERVVREQGYSCEGASDASTVRERLREGSYRLALLDVNMPGESGMDLLAHIRREYPEVAVMMVTGEDSTKLAMTAIELGAYGYLVKPLGAGELLINVANALHRWRAEAESRRLVERLQATVQDGSHTLEEALQDLELSETKVWVSQAETIFRLARMVEFRDEETGHHVHRMSSYCEILARRMGSSAQHCELIRLASQLHDVGKVAVPDSILLKRGKLTPEEFEVIKSHAETGYQMLAGSAAEVVQLGALIARTHHERWDGGGYPRGLAGEDIPQEGRIAAVADVFDALTSDRVYRSALPVRSAIKMMQDERGRHFDPELLDAFFAARSEIDSIRQAYSD
jgi:putative two-component system response regulator